VHTGRPALTATGDAVGERGPGIVQVHETEGSVMPGRRSPEPGSISGELEA